MEIKIRRNALQYSKYTLKGSYLETDDTADFVTSAETIEHLQILSGPQDAHDPDSPGRIVLAGTSSGGEIQQIDVVATAVNGIVIAHSLPNDPE